MSKATEDKLKAVIIEQSILRQDYRSKQSIDNNIFIISGIIRIIQKMRTRRKRTRLEEISEKVRKQVNAEEEGKAYDEYVDDIMKEVND